MISTSLDERISKDNICRIICGFVEMLDMAKLGFEHAEANVIGRPAYNPRNLLMLYIYGYLNQMRSSRRLEAECHRNIEVMWLMQNLTPDDKTICEFRRKHAKAFKNVFLEFSVWCNKEGLYGKELIAVDGTKIRANCSKKNIHSKKLTEKQLKIVNEKTEKYLAELERNDNDDPECESSYSKDEISEILKGLNERKKKLESYMKQIEENDEQDISMIDPDCRIMHQGGNARSLDACYNVQSVVDEKNKLLLDFEVSTHPNDKGSLPRMSERAKEIMELSKIKVLADKGHYYGEDIDQCEKNGTICLVAKISDTSKAPSRHYRRDKFKYDKESDNFICPEGKRLFFKRTNKDINGKPLNRLYTNPNACRCCEKIELCTTSKTGRNINRAANQEALDIVDERMKKKENRKLYKKRQEIVEHPFGTVKHSWGYRQFLCRGQEKVSGEQSLAFLAYNLLDSVDWKNMI